MKVSLDKIIPFTEARANLSKLVEEVEGNLFFVINKQNKKRAVLVDPDYFESLVKQAESQRMLEIRKTLQKKFLAYAKKKLGKKNITEKEAYKLLTGEELSW